MTYSTGGLIQATDLNGFVSTTSGGNINAVLASYGQTTLNTVATGAIVTASQWAGLNTSVTNMAQHQGTAITARTNPTAGGIISVLAALGTDITNLNTNKLNATAQGTQYTAWTGSSSKTTSTGSGGSAWSITFTHTMTFGNTAQAQYFFNAGGLVKIQMSKTSTGTTEDTAWNSFIGSGGGGYIADAIYLSADGASKTIVGTTFTGTTKFGGTGTPTILATATGFNQLTSTPTTIYQQYDGGPAYSSNYVAIAASYSGSTITFTTTWYNSGAGLDATISGGTASSGISFGSAPSVIVTYTPPSTSYLTNSWGTPTVSASVA